MEKKAFQMLSLRLMSIWFAIALAMGISSSYGHPADNTTDNTHQEDNNAKESDWKVRHKARNVLEIILQIHSFNAKHKKPYSLRSNDKSSEHTGEQTKNNGSEKHQVKENVD